MLITLKSRHTTPASSSLPSQLVYFLFTYVDLSFWKAIHDVLHAKQILNACSVQELCSLLELQRSKKDLSLFLRMFMVYWGYQEAQRDHFSLFGQYSRVPQSGWLVNKRKLFLTVPQAGKSKVNAPADSMSAETHLLVHRQQSFCCVLAW